MYRREAPTSRANWHPGDPGAPSVLTRRLEKVWPQVQDLQVKLEPQTPQIFATGSDHYVQIHDPDMVIRIIRVIVDRARHRE